MSLIQTEGLTKRFGSVTAVDGLTVEVAPGVTGLVGANGAGKSTLPKVLLGLLPASERTARLLDLDVATDGPAIRERVGYMPEHDCLPPDVSTTEFVMRRDFTAQAPNQRYLGDITYLPIADGTNLYLATVIDCSSPRVAGWAVADHMRTDLVEDPLTAAKTTTGSLAGAIFHSDTVYTSQDDARLCAELGVVQSMGAVGSSADNALAESFNATLKREVLQDAACWPEETTCRRDVFRWLVRYNNRRRHSWCRYQSPVAYETGYAATLPSAA